MKCVRCLHDTAEVVAKAPDGSNAWELYFCSTCNYSWRNNEVESIPRSTSGDPWCQLDKVDFTKLRKVEYQACEEMPEHLKKADLLRCTHDSSDCFH